MAVTKCSCGTTSITVTAIDGTKSKITNSHNQPNGNLCSDRSAYVTSTGLPAGGAP